jgi:hypothetical protein
MPQSHKCLRAEGRHADMKMQICSFTNVGMLCVGIQRQVHLHR